MDGRRGEHLSGGGRRSAAERQLPQEANYPDATPRIHIALAALLPLFGNCALDLLSFLANPCLPKSKHPRKTSKMVTPQKHPHDHSIHHEANSSSADRAFQLPIAPPRHPPPRVHKHLPTRRGARPARP